MKIGGIVKCGEEEENGRRRKERRKKMKTVAEEKENRSVLSTPSLLFLLLFSFIISSTSSSSPYPSHLLPPVLPFPTLPFLVLRLFPVPFSLPLPLTLFSSSSSSISSGTTLSDKCSTFKFGISGFSGPRGYFYQFQLSFWLFVKSRGF